MGFCLVNNVAVGAAALAARGQRVAIVDWDVHHGNGTQDIFYDDPDVLYVSTHEYPLYPGSGRADETGGAGAPMSNLNLPFPAGTRGDVYRRAFDEVIAPVIERFAPDWLFISAGFDAHRNDPLAGLELTAADYADLAVRLQQLVPARRTVVVLEGGYDFEALSRSTGSTLSALVGGSYRPEEASTGEVGLPTVVAARQRWELD
jgi:acetoin utilization deacetylase AcuC-like enzyme